jgi:AcrR family transcriptional regulator
MGLAAFRERRGDAKRAAVLEAARAGFAARGYAEVSTAEIARLAGVSTATLYRHFPTKLDLFAAVLEAAVEDLKAGLAAAEGLEGLCLAYARLLSQPQARAIVRMAVTGGDPGISQRFYESGKAATNDLFAAAVAAEVEAGRTAPDADPGQLMGMIEHPTLLLGLLAGDDRPTARPPEVIAGGALETWRARFARA